MTRRTAIWESSKEPRRDWVCWRLIFSISSLLETPLMAATVFSTPPLLLLMIQWVTLFLQIYSVFICLAAMKNFPRSSYFLFVVSFLIKEEHIYRRVGSTLTRWFVHSLNFGTTHHHLQFVPGFRIVVRNTSDSESCSSFRIYPSKSTLLLIII